MSKIRVLNDHLTNMIAAGEVVERPAGIIKELVENSIDAGASNIIIRVKEAGMSLIEVSDDGEGMLPEDLLQAFQRHSTSKIHDKDDLNAIKSFGFRGEALPSIASVTNTHASSKTQDGTGYFLEIDNGKVIDKGAYARNQGTTMTIKNLFLKTPARLKYIKSIRYENSIIIDTIQKFALGQSNISFTLISDERESYRSIGNGDIFNVFARMYGSTVAKDSMTFEESNFDFKIEGVMALPMHSRANRNAIILYINNRMIRFPKVQNAIINGYRRHMPSDRFPIVVMNITVDPQLVDVNVHPSKWEIRLSKEDVLQALIIDRFETLLADHMKPQTILSKPKEHVEQLDMLEPLIDKQAYIKESVFKPANFSSDSLLEKEETQQADIIIPEPIVSTTEQSIEVEEKIVEAAHEEAIEISKSVSIEPLKVLSQFAGNYILAQADSGLYIIDQHAAMERIRYEYYQELLLNHQYDHQPLLIPLLFQGRRGLVERVDEVNDHLEQFQLKLDVLGDDTFALREYPLWIKEKELSHFIDIVLDGFESEVIMDKESLRQNVLATLACHSSVRFNEYLSMAEMEQLVEDLRSCQQGYHCPHGRPTFLTLEHSFLLKEFKR